VCWCRFDQRLCTFVGGRTSTAPKGRCSGQEPVSPSGGEIARLIHAFGDIIEIHGERIRLFGIDAPESGQTCLDAKGQSYRCGQKAALVLDARIGEGVVTCERKDTDRYGRVVALCRVFGDPSG